MLVGNPWFPNGWPSSLGPHVARLRCLCYHPWKHSYLVKEKLLLDNKPSEKWPLCGTGSLLLISAAHPEDYINPDHAYTQTQNLLHLSAFSKHFPGDGAPWRLLFIRRLSHLREKKVLYRKAILMACAMVLPLLGTTSPQPTASCGITLGLITIQSLLLCQAMWCAATKSCSF